MPSIWCLDQITAASWESREASLKQLTRNLALLLVPSFTDEIERRPSDWKLSRSNNIKSILEACCAIVAYGCTDPVFAVYQAALVSEHLPKCFIFIKHSCCRTCVGYWLSLHCAVLQQNWITYKLCSGLYFLLFSPDIMILKSTSSKYIQHTVSSMYYIQDLLQLFFCPLGTSESALSSSYVYSSTLKLVYSALSTTFPLHFVLVELNVF